jgi:hypothetical protein
VLASVAALAADPSWYAKKATWHETMTASLTALAGSKPEAAAHTPLPNFGKDPYTVTAWIRTRRGGTIVAKAPAKGEWVEQGKSIFVEDGKLSYDIGWVGCVNSRRGVGDGKWHHVAVVGRPADVRLHFYIDGRLDTTGRLDAQPDAKEWPTKIGYTSNDFGGAFRGELDEVRIYNRALPADRVKALFEKGAPESDSGLVGRWSFESSGNDGSGSGNHAATKGKVDFAAGKSGKALKLEGSGHLVVAGGGGAGPATILWGLVARDFPDDVSRQEISWERADGIWPGWRAGDLPGLARRYAEASERSSAKARTLASKVTDTAGLARVRKLYLRSRRYGLVLEKLGKFNLKGLRKAIVCLARRHPESEVHLARLDALEQQAARWGGGGGEIDGAALAKWKVGLEGLRREALVTGNPLLKCGKLVFAKRYTFQSGHFYTDFIDGCDNFGGNLCILDLKTGKVTGLVPKLKDGIFGRFDLHYDAKRIVFGWKRSRDEGFRIYEVGVDGTGLRQITFPPPDEDERVKKYGVNFKTRGHGRNYNHHTDDMHPCYLPDGGIVFTSTRCEYGTLCNGDESLTTAVIYRIDGDGKNMERLTNSSVSEFSPTIMNDGRILYTRWEYVDKGQLGIKCLWAMRPDGSGTAEIFGNDIQYPPTLLHGRAIPGHNNLYVVLGTPHYPQAGYGTVIRLDINYPIRTRKPMQYITPHVDVRQEPGWNHLVNGRWVRHTNGPLYMDPYPLSPELYLVSHNPDKRWNDTSAYGLYLIDEFGNHVPIYKDPEFSCWVPTPLRPRERPELPSALPPVRARVAPGAGSATVVMSDVYQGLRGIERGTVKYLRIMEQVPRPWSARHFWDPGFSHTSIVSKGPVLGLKVLHGIVPVHEDGSAHFTVPTDKNIYFQALDADFMEIQRQRTYVNYRPGERRSCVGCHEMRAIAPASKYPMALQHPPSKPQAQPGETAPRVLHYPTDVQPVLDKHCVRCHSGKKPKGKMDLTGAPTELFSRSYENFLRRRLVKTFNEGGDWDGSAAVGPKTVGSHASRLIKHLRKGHQKVKLSREEWIKIVTWVDSNAQYYGSYYGRRRVRYKDHPNYRPVPTVAGAIDTKPPLPEENR